MQIRCFVVTFAARAGGGTARPSRPTPHAADHKSSTSWRRAASDTDACGTKLHVRGGTGPTTHITPTPRRRAGPNRGSDTGTAAKRPRRGAATREAARRGNVARPTARAVSLRVHRSFDGFGGHEGARGDPSSVRFPPLIGGRRAASLTVAWRQVVSSEFGPCRRGLGRRVLRT